MSMEDYSMIASIRLKIGHKVFDKFGVVTQFELEQIRKVTPSNCIKSKTVQGQSTIGHKLLFAF